MQRSQIIICKTSQVSGMRNSKNQIKKTKCSPSIFTCFPHRVLVPCYPGVQATGGACVFNQTQNNFVETEHKMKRNGGWSTPQN